MPLRFANREEALAWICKNQLGRRNFSPEQKRYLLGKQYESEKKAEKIFHGNQYTLAKKSGGSHDDTHHSGKKTCDRIAEENGVSRVSVLRASHYTRDIDIADNLSPGIKQKDVYKRQTGSERNADSEEISTNKNRVRPPGRTLQKSTHDKSGREFPSAEFP